MLQFYRTLHMFTIHKSWWWFKPPGMWHYHWVSGPDVPKDHGASLLGSSSPRQDILFWVPDLVDECTVILLNVGNFSPNNTVSQLRKPRFSAKTVNSLKSHKLSQCSCLAFIIQEQGIVNILVLIERWPDFKYGLLVSVLQKCKTQPVRLCMSSPVSS
jgi:hypothetical protein